jgi:predicted alpha/beta hydrolase family esterase
MTNYLIVPGLGGSGPDHWQTYFESTGTNFHRIIQKDWDAPDINEWVETIDNAISAYDPQTVVLVGHSLGCPTIATWASYTSEKIKGALLVAPPDIEAFQKKLHITLFKNLPTDKIQFPTIVVASTNDHWSGIQKAEWNARQWGSEFINIGEAGHINDQSGFGKWEEGLKILHRLSDEH